METDDPNVDHSLTGLRSREDSACPLDGKEEGHRVEQVGERVSATAICDGRGNAGTGARAAVLYVGDGPRRDRYERAEKLPATTNIVAEHLAIQLAMELAKEHGVTDLVICNDSRSPVNHVNGNYKVKAQHLTAIVEKTWAMRAPLRFAGRAERTPRRLMLSVGQSMRERHGLLQRMISDSGATSHTAYGRAVASRPAR
jgi:ribonuclease HI